MFEPRADDNVSAEAVQDEQSQNADHLGDISLWLVDFARVDLTTVILAGK